MSGADCVCHLTDPKTWTTYGGAVEPGSAMEPNPDCAAHFPGQVIPEAAVTAAVGVSLRQLGLHGKPLPEGLLAARQASIRELLEAAAPSIRAQALEEMADAILTNDPLDFWDMHLPEGLGFQEAMSRWLKAHARAKMSQTPHGLHNGSDCGTNTKRPAP